MLVKGVQSDRGPRRDPACPKSPAELRQEAIAQRNESNGKPNGQRLYKPEGFKA